MHTFFHIMGNRIFKRFKNVFQDQVHVQINIAPPEITFQHLCSFCNFIHLDKQQCELSFTKHTWYLACQIIQT